MTTPIIEESSRDHFANPPACRLGCLAYLTDERGRVLLVQPENRDGYWQLPGGCAEENEQVTEAVRRTVSLKTGLKVTPGSILVVDQVPSNAQKNSAQGVNFVFDCGTIPSDTTITLPCARPDGTRWIRGAAFFPLDEELAALTLPYQHKRIMQATAARANGQTPLLWHGDLVLPTA